MVNAGYNIFAELFTSKTGFPRLLHNGKTYGVKNKSMNEAEIQWRCTKSGTNPNDNMSKTQCKATVKTRLINGYTMMRVQNPFHICS